MASLQKKNIKGHDYWYIVESKRINGKPTPVILQYLGTVDNLLNLLQGGPNEFKSYAHGAVAALVKIAQKIGILEIMGQHLPGQMRGGPHFYSLRK